jgi:hypothetical protein
MIRPAKKNHLPAWASALVFTPLALGAIYLMLITSSSDTFSFKKIMQYFGAPIEVRYEIELPALCKGQISYYKNGSIEQRIGDLLWSTSFESKRGQPVSMSLQNQCDYGDIKAQIFVDGKLFQEATSSGPYAVAVVSGGLLQ